jgi:hypothetical protein
MFDAVAAALMVFAGVATLLWGTGGAAGRVRGGGTASEAATTKSAMTRGTASGGRSSGVPEFSADGKLVRPEDYRRWVFLSSGYDMSYAQGEDDTMHMFSNVFVPPAAYEYFVANGKWPDKTMFALEFYGATGKGSINKHGSFQNDFLGLEVEVKDEKRFADKWAYFGFDNGEQAAEAIAPSQNGCWKCHEQNAAVEHSFVQFYPTLLKIAKEKGTMKAGMHLEGRAAQ